MGSRGKKKTTMAKLARENRLRERRLDKEARRDARKRAPGDERGIRESVPVEGTPLGPPEAAPAMIRAADEVPRADRDMSDPNDERASALGPGAAEARGPAALAAEPSDPREKEAALLRLRDASDEELALFEDSLREGALDAGATEREMRDAQSDHPSHSG